MKNPNGFGTVTKMSGKRRKKWRAVKTIGWENGVQKRITIGYFESKTEGLEALGKYIYNPNAKLKLKDVYDMWSKVHYEKVSESRVMDLKSRYKKYIYLLEDECISEITLQQLQNFIDNLNCSSGTISQIKSMLGMVFDYALKHEFIDKNPVKFIELGKYEKVYEKKIFTDEEIQILWNNINIPYVDTILILIYTGMRVGEMLNLKLEDINLENKTIFIPKSKTSAGIRYIPINDKIFPVIVKKMYNQKYLVANPKGERYGYTSYKYNFENTLKRLGIQPHTPHECRHTTATLLSNAGANPISIAKIMGHTDYNGMTAKVYTHKNEIELEKAMNTLN